jgi:hypothetical protein
MWILDSVTISSIRKAKLVSLNNLDGECGANDSSCFDLDFGEESSGFAPFTLYKIFEPFRGDKNACGILLIRTSRGSTYLATFRYEGARLDCLAFKSIMLVGIHDGNMWWSYSRTAILYSRENIIVTGECSTQSGQDVNGTVEPSGVGSSYAMKLNVSISSKGEMKVRIRSDG